MLCILEAEGHTEQPCAAGAAVERGWFLTKRLLLRPEGLGASTGFLVGVSEKPPSPSQPGMFLGRGHL